MGSTLGAAVPAGILGALVSFDLFDLFIGVSIPVFEDIV